MRRPSSDEQIERMNHFNAKYTPGETVYLKTDSGTTKTVKLRTEAYVTADGKSVVAFFEGIKGYQLICRVIGKVSASDLQTIN